MRRQIVIVAAVTFCSLGTSPGMAGTIRSDRPDSLYTNLARLPQYQSVGRIEWNQGGFSFGGSGVSITDDWVLTAGHVVGGTDDAGGGISSMTFTVANRRYVADEWIAHPEWTSSGGSLDLGVDLGLVRLTRSVLVDPASVYEGSNVRGEVGTIVGYGATGNGTDGVDESLPNAKRAGNNVLDSVRGDIIEIDFDNPTRRSDSSFGSSSPLRLEYLPASGDSGGGLFIDTADGTQLTGITSYTAATDLFIDSDYGDLAGFVQISSHLEWIESIVGDLDAVLGDFNSDKLLTAADIDLLTQQIKFNTTDPLYDVNEDGSVDLSDRVFWVEDIFQTHMGDLNLDGRVDDIDLALLNETMFNFGTGWATGDFNGDQNTDVSDWNIWNDNFGMLGAAAVPEPAFGWLAGLLAATLVFRRRTYLLAMSRGVRARGREDSLRTV